VKIGEIAKAVGMTTSRIRFYEKRGIIPPASRDKNGYRDYPPDVMTKLQFIQQAQHLGFTLSEVAEVRPSNKGHPISCAVAIELLTAKLSSIDALMVEAQQRKQAIKIQIEELRHTQRNNQESS
jgi:MerR family transcriptional regulator, copper efflux regulator